ncbi:HET-domain-containing [Fusarium albosuccineum]|uniref:HET-domain-containing n=1 Tax=Fusarium albosuccineum TaxID=1237068 RepID=A0A8H4LF22_9HYPO|nr:HET-domain-containing [Fusarium albosuccineum]
MACHVCETIIDVYSADFEEYDEEILGQVSTVFSSTCPHAESLQRAGTFDQPITNFPDELLVVRKDERQTGIRLGLAHLTPDDQIIFDNVSITSVDLIAQDNQPDHSGQAILPDRNWIDLDVVRGWMATCKNHHQAQCHEPPWLKGVSAAEPEWFIDVIQDCIVAPPRIGVDYVALSYTWGLGRNLKNTKGTLRELQQPGALKLPHFAAQLPETIRNTIDLVKALGERYLWIDALCIIQDDPASLSRNLNQMQLIYANSVFCIMAAAGCGAEFGLRGLSGLSPARDLEVELYDLAGGERLLEVVRAFSLDAGTKYSYSQRGWTFQEWLFSRRRLVFNDGPLVWQCQCARWKETSKVNAEADSRWARMSRSKDSALDPSPSIWDFMPMASTFNTKALTMQEDAPRAFTGIQAMLHRVHPGGILYGLSEFFFEIALAWSSLYSDVERRRASDATKSLEDGLPSWSWLGWHGDINFPYDAEFQLMQPWHYHEQKVGFREPVTEWFTMASPNGTIRRRVRSEWYNCKSSHQVSAVELPSGWTRQQYEQQEYPHDFNPPGQEPDEIFAHDLNPQQKFKYPVPVLNWSDTPVLNDQTQYLYSETSRAHLAITSSTMVVGVADYKRRIRVEDNNKHAILSLTLHDSKKAKDFLDKDKAPKSLELIAFAKGWSTWLGDDLVKRDYEHGAGKLRVPGMDPRECYFVLWVERRGCVAYRRACGEVLASWWEENREKEAAQTILG